MTAPSEASVPAERPLRVRGPVVASLLGYGVSVLTNLAAVPLFLRAFGQELYGFWGAILALTSYLSLLNLGVAQTVSSRAAVLAATQDVDEAARSVLYGVRKFAQAVGLAAIPICIAAWLAPWKQIFHVEHASATVLSSAAFLVALTFLVQLPLGVPRAALTGMGGVTIDRAIGMIGSLLRLLVAWLVLKLHWSLATSVLALFSVDTLAALAAAIALRSHIPGVWSLRHFRPPKDPASFKRASAHYLLLQIAGALVWSTDAFLAGVLLDARAAAQIAVAWRVAAAALPLGQLVGPAISPTLVRAWTQRRFEEADRLASTATQLAVGLTTAATVTLAFAADPIFSIWVGRRVFVGHTTWTAYCALVTLQALLAIPHAFVLLAGRHRLYSRWTLIEAVTKTLLTLALVPTLGLAGFPLATLLGRVPTAYILLRETAHSFDMRIGRWVARQLRPSFVASPVLSIIALPLFLPQLRSTTWMLCTAGAAATLFVIVFWTFGLSRSVRADLLRAVRLRA